MVESSEAAGSESKPQEDLAQDLSQKLVLDNGEERKVDPEAEETYELTDE